jgi:hypothetical protein
MGVQPTPGTPAIQTSLNDLGHDGACHARRLEPLHRPGGEKAALHEDDGMMPVLSGDGCRQTNDVSCLRPPGDKFKARCRQMVAFVDNKMSVTGKDIGNLSIAHQALDECHIDNARRLSFPTADNSDLFRINVQKRPQALHPLGEQFPAMNKNQSIASSISDECGGDNRLAEGRHGGEHAVAVGHESLESLGL